MIKRTVYISSPSHLAVKNDQLTLTNKSSGELDSLPLEDIGFVMLDNRQITYTNHVLQRFAELNIAAVICGSSHLPVAMLCPLDGNNTQTETFSFQLNASEPLKKTLWKQTINAKIRNQAALLAKLGKDNKYLLNLAKDVKSGDTDNREAVAAKYYWSNLFDIKGFKRQREGIFPNSLLNYAYSVIRAGIARSLMGSGLLPMVGIHHKNKYNPMCLADDIMEPFRPFADELVIDFIKNNNEEEDISKEFKIEAFHLLSADTEMKNLKRPMMIAFTFTTSSLAKCFAGKLKNINYPVLK